MAQYANEYEGMGSALMNIGSMYYSQSEKRKEEERLRKEKEDERKYLAAQSEAEWQRKAPAEKIKAALAELRLAEAGRSKYTVAGNQLIEQRMVRNADGKLEPVEGRETLSPLNPYNQRPAAAPRPVSMDGPQGPGMYIPDGAGGYTKIGKPLPKAAAATAKDPNVLGVAERARIEMQVLSEQAALDAMSDSDLQFSKKTTRAAEQAKINAKKSVLDKYSQKAAPDSGGSVASGLFKALMGGVAAAPLGRTEESAAAAGITGKVPLGVAAQSIAASTGEPVNLMGAEGTPPSPKAQENKQPAPGSTKETAILVTSAEQMAAIPDGTWVKTPKGTTRRK